MLRTKLKFIKNVIYRLKRSYGLPIQYYIITGSEVDPTTGEKTVVYSKFDIRKAIVLKAREYRSFVYDLAYISANKDFTTGGFFDPEDRRIIISATDVPSGIEPEVGHFVVFQNFRYDIKEVTSLENNYAWLLLAKKIKGAPVSRIENTLSVLGMTQSVNSITVDKLVRTVKSSLSLTDNLQEVP